MLQNYYSNGGGFGVQVITRIGFLFFAWLTCIAYKDYGIVDYLFMLERYLAPFIMFALFGCIFIIVDVSWLFVVWRFFLELAFCLLWISLPFDLAILNGWKYLSAFLFLIMCFYSIIYSMRFFCWNEFKRSLLMHGKLQDCDGTMYFRFCRRGYDEIYNFSTRLAWTKVFCFWEHGFFSRTIDLEKRFRIILWIVFTFALGSMILDSLFVFDFFGLIIFVSFVILYPQLLRVSLAPSLLDMILSTKYPSKDKAIF